MPELVTPIGTVTSPDVTLSPNARKRVLASRGAAWTVTPKLHDAEAPAASCAEQFTVVDPTGNICPDAGEHDTVTGNAPPEETGKANVAGAPATPVAGVVTDAGQVIASGRGSGVGVAEVGDDGSSPHAAASIVRPKIRTTGSGRLERRLCSNTCIEKQLA
jgi:hypothetical protein